METHSASSSARSWAIGFCLALGLFALADAMSLTFVYIEGDDAASIAYHALGRLPDLQPPYSAYQSMMDVLMRSFPANEHVLRIGGMLITALFAPLLVILIALLIADWTRGLLRIPPWATVILIPLLAPEFIYLGLVYTPALIAMSAAIGAHLVLRYLIRRPESEGSSVFRSPWFYFSILLFGAGTAFRWDALAYGAVIVADILLSGGLTPGERPPLELRLQAGLSWGTAAIAAWFLMVAASGYGPAAILRTLQISGPSDQYQSLLVTGATLQTLVTPALLLCAFIGFMLLVIRRDRFAIVVVVGMVLVARFLKFGDPKFILVAVPGLLACAMVGFSEVWTRFTPMLAPGNWKAFAVRAGLLVVMLAPWLIGVQAIFGDSAYGPGFEIKPFDHPRASTFMKITAGPGALVPTLEGPRPIGGHLWVLFAGKWRERVRRDSLEQTIAINSALANHIPLLQDNGEGYAVTALAGMGFTTQDSWKRLIGPSYVLERRFTSEDQKYQVRMLRLKSRDNLYTAGGISELEDAGRARTVVVYGYTSTLRKLYKLAPGSLQRLDTATALLDLEKLRHAITVLVGRPDHPHTSFANASSKLARE